MIWYGAVPVLLLTGLVLFSPQAMSWAYVAGVVAFEAWLRYRIASLGGDPLPADEAPYRFSEAEARLVGRYRFYFHSPVAARASASVLAAAGLTGLLLAPWLTYHHAYVQAVLVGANVFAAARLTRQVAPVNALRQSASRGDREALAQLEAHESAWAKIRSANAAHP